MLNRYDVENIEEDLFEYCKKTVFSEPQVDYVTEKLDTDCKVIFAVEYLPGQFDQRADSAEQCIQIISQKERPIVKSAKVYMLYGNLTEEDINAIKKHLINPIESREATLEEYKTLSVQYEMPTKVETLDGFIELDEEGLKDFIKQNGLAMDIGDIKCCQRVFYIRK